MTPDADPAIETASTEDAATTSVPHGAAPLDLDLIERELADVEADLAALDDLA